MSDDEFMGYRNEEDEEVEEDEVLDVVEAEELTREEAVKKVADILEERDEFEEERMFVEEQAIRDAGESDEDEQSGFEKEEEEGDDDEPRLVVGGKQGEHLTGRMSGNSNEEKKFDIAAKEFGLTDDEKDELKKKLFGRTEPYFRIQYKNPIGLILGHLMYVNIDVHEKSKESAFEMANRRLSRLISITRKKKKEDDPEPLKTVTDVDIVRYYTFWKKSVMNK